MQVGYSVHLYFANLQKIFFYLTYLCDNKLFICLLILFLRTNCFIYIWIPISSASTLPALQILHLPYSMSIPQRWWGLLWVVNKVWHISWDRAKYFLLVYSNSNLSYLICLFLKKIAIRISIRDQKSHIRPDKLKEEF